MAATLPWSLYYSPDFNLPYWLFSHRQRCLFVNISFKLQLCCCSDFPLHVHFCRTWLLKEEIHWLDPQDGDQGKKILRKITQMKKILFIRSFGLFLIFFLRLVCVAMVLFYFKQNYVDHHKWSHFYDIYSDMDIFYGNCISNLYS